MIFFHLIVAVLFFISSTFALEKKKKGVFLVWKGNPFVIVLFLYLAGAVSSIFIDNTMLPSFEFSKHKNESYLMFTLFTFLLLIPVLRMKGAKFNPFILSKKRSVKIFLYVLSFLIWFSFLYQVPFAIKAVSVGAVEVRNSLNVDGQSYLPSNFFTTIAVVVSSFYVVFAVLFFSCVKEGFGFYMRVSFFMGSALYLVSSMAFSARDGALFWIMTMAFVYGVYSPSLPVVIRKKMIKYAVVFFVPAILMVVSFTIQRFYNEGSYERLLVGSVGYLGQQPYVFSETVLKQNDFYGLSLRFPLLAPLFGQETTVVRTEVYEWTFGGIPKDFYSVGGVWSLILLTFCFVVPFIVAFHRNIKASINNTIIMSVYFQVVTSGIFYFRLGTRGGNLYLILLLLIVLVIYFGSKLSKRYR